ncbi:MAG: thioredoxin-dependent thiol peroxidase [Chlorobiota bacterium]|nr:thioredoxin-dependent thiol peroxidase [Chlorobiota bacterium]QQS67785.1 MAG: thioredoxin-dependent thiol peroxidase [Chlorobiota bacterium]
MLKIGDKAPSFTALDQNETIHSLSDYLGKKIVIYFYPKDMTSGCTTESCDFRDNLSRVKSGGAFVFGISPDSVKSHKKFEEKESLNFPLLSDQDKQICKAYFVWKEKSLYGKKYFGVERTTYIIDENGIISKIFNKVTVSGHVEDVLINLTQM